MLEAVVLRSRHAHARIVRVDARRARVDARRAGRPHRRRRAREPPSSPTACRPPKGAERYLQPAIARGVVRYVGEPVALVVADDPLHGRGRPRRRSTWSTRRCPRARRWTAALAPGSAAAASRAPTPTTWPTISMRVGDADAALAARRAGAPRALPPSAADRRRAGDARAARRAARRERRRAAPHRLDQVHPHQSHASSRRSSASRWAPCASPRWTWAAASGCAASSTRRTSWCRSPRSLRPARAAGSRSGARTSWPPITPARPCARLEMGFDRRRDASAACAR